ncbi:hypothetical protein [Aneurinibacillus aneurinilyticus]|nr:hypothetical protein [Aneurinibacillus aneurinilyticus]MED0708895.1 hypothetical protein [Aneurinibacillus aneurinilyticus]MED0724387.1 hypothetical protein [Aneurinibacillus aneurinilyticus]MED0735168.1 hypothetical protein [Aneurinibacillus aneurinilyticus]MED0742334.1 hypothetical protein [Aneurinibacillus aneurinilyticus]
MKQMYVMHCTWKYKNWRDLFSYCLNNANKFRIVFPGSMAQIDPNNPLGEGKKEFLNLKDIEIKNATNTKDSIQVEGVLGKESRDLLLKFQEPSFNGNMSHLWNFSIQKDDVFSLEIQDFSVALLTSSENYIKELEKTGINITNEWDKVTEQR